MDEETPEVIRAADDAYEAIRTINHEYVNCSWPRGDGYFWPHLRVC